MNRMSTSNINMDKGVQHLSPNRASLANLWDSVEADSENWTEDRVYHQEPQRHIGYHDQNKYNLPHGGNSGSLEQGYYEDEDEAQDIQVYDSLEVESHPHAKSKVHLLKAECLDTHINQREGTSELLSSDSYSELRYDPNWRNNLKGNSRFSENPEIYIEEYYPDGESSQLCPDKQKLEKNGGYRYVVDTSPAVTPSMAVSESDQPYHLHPQEAQTAIVASLNCHKHALQLRSTQADLSRPPSISTVNESDNTSRRGFTEKCEDGCDNAENVSTSPELTGGILALESQTCYQQELRHTQRGPSQTQTISTSPLKSSKVLRNKKRERMTKDIVECNKITLGRNTSKGGSYMRVHAFKQEMAHDANKVPETLKEAVSPEKHEDSTDPELTWLQKIQQLQVIQISKGKKAQRKKYPDPSQQQQPPAQGVRTEWRDRLRSPLARPAAVTQTKSQKMTSPQTLPTTIHLNINLNTSSHLLSLLQEKGQEAVINLASLLGHPQWNHASTVQLALSPGNQQTDAGKSFLMSTEKLNAQLYQRNPETSSEHCQRTSALKLPLSCDREDQNWSLNEVHTEQVLQNISSYYPVLPPIGKPLTEKEHKLSPGQFVNTSRPIHRSSSDSYLSQMKKQKQLKDRVTNKACSLKDYKQMKPDTNLRDVEPDYTATEKTKMKRQKLYSKVIYEQNKKISRIPSLLAKDPESNDKKVPRMKALEYAKTIARPPLQSQPKQRQKQQPEGFTEHVPYLQGLDASQLATLELLRKRHEEEKQAVAHFRKVHAV